MATIRDYNVTVSNTTASIKVNNQTKTSYAALPTIAEIQSVTGKPVEVIDLSDCFRDCYSLTTAPAIPSGVTNMSYCFRECNLLTTAPTIPSSVTNMFGCFMNCNKLTTAPAIPSSVTDMNYCFESCSSLTTAPTIPSSVTNMFACFAGCNKLTTAPTIPSGVTNMGYCFNRCTALTGKITINANPSTYTYCMAYTQNEIMLTGSSTLLQNIANTATNNNVYVWSLSINLSAERQEDDFSKANVSVTINRFRNNNESVSLKFTMNGVEGAQVQVTMDTVTKTYTGVLSITPFSTVELSVIAEDSYGKSAPKSITMPIPFYTIDFQAGGKEIAVGAPANDDTSNHPNGLFKCVMDAQFGRNAEFYGNLVLGTALSIANGGTGATTAAGAMANLGVADYIVEQGTSGIWTYRKYSSGIIECWTTTRWATPTLTMSAISSSGTYKSNTLSMPFPTDLFTDVENCFNVRFGFMSSGTYLLSVMNSAPSNSVLPVVIVKGGSSTSACSIYAHAVGRWK